VSVDHGTATTTTKPVVLRRDADGPALRWLSAGDDRLQASVQHVLNKLTDRVSSDLPAGTTVAEIEVDRVAGCVRDWTMVVTGDGDE
jgi:hypothetical protein